MCVIGLHTPNTALYRCLFIKEAMTYTFSFSPCWLALVCALVVLVFPVRGFWVAPIWGHNDKEVEYGPAEGYDNFEQAAAYKQSADEGDRGMSRFIIDVEFPSLLNIGIFIIILALVDTSGTL